MGETDRLQARGWVQQYVVSLKHRKEESGEKGVHVHVMNSELIHLPRPFKTSGNRLFPKVRGKSEGGEE